MSKKLAKILMLMMLALLTLLGPYPTTSIATVAPVAAKLSSETTVQCDYNVLAFDDNCVVTVQLAEGEGSYSHKDDVSFCQAHTCIPSFVSGQGYVVQCKDGKWSHSGGFAGECGADGGAVTGSYPIPSALASGEVTASFIHPGQLMKVPLQRPGPNVPQQSAYGRLIRSQCKLSQTEAVCTIVFVPSTLYPSTVYISYQGDQNYSASQTSTSNMNFTLVQLFKLKVVRRAFISPYFLTRKKTDFVPALIHYNLKTTVKVNFRLQKKVEGKILRGHCVAIKAFIDAAVTRDRSCTRSRDTHYLFTTIGSKGPNFLAFSSLVRDKSRLGEGDYRVKITPVLIGKSAKSAYALLIVK